MQLLKSKNGNADDKNGRNGKSVLPMERLYRPTDKEPFMNERQREYFRLASRLTEKGAAPIPSNTRARQ